MQLIRYFQNNIVTLGLIKINNQHSPIFTLELPWKDNKKEVSCIPVGKYGIRPHNSEKYPDTFEITGVPDREAILIHVGNYTRDTKGCVLVGLGVVVEQPMVNNSGAALRTLRGLMSDITEIEVLQI